jgi:hypothetical protein
MKVLDFPLAKITFSYVFGMWPRIIGYLQLQFQYYIFLVA